MDVADFRVSEDGEKAGRRNQRDEAGALRLVLLKREKQTENRNQHDSPADAEQSRRDAACNACKKKSDRLFHFKRHPASKRQAAAAIASRLCPRVEARRASRIRQTIASAYATTSAQRCGRQRSRLAASRRRNKFRHENRRHPSSGIPATRRVQSAEAIRKETSPARHVDPCAKGEPEREPTPLRHQYPVARREFRRIDRSRERRCTSEVQFPSGATLRAQL